MTVDSPGAIVAVAAAWLVIAALALLPAGNAFAARRLAFPLGALIGLALSALGLQAIWLPAAQLTLPLGLPDLPFHLRVDPLAGFFLMLLGSVSAGISVYATGYFRDETAGRLALIGLQYHVFLASMAFVILADDAYLFMVAWETMALSSYFLVTTDHKLPAVRSAGFLYLLIAHLGALAILLCFGVMHGGHGDYTFDALRSTELDPRWATVAFLLAFFGFGAKAGMIPLHAWLPEAHPAAPSPVSALMSGIMLKTAIYGMVRVIYDLIGAARRRGAAPNRAAAGRNDPQALRAFARHPARGRGLLQRLRTRDPRRQRSALQPRTARHQVRGEPAACRHAARHRAGVAQHGNGAQAHLRSHARTQAGSGDR